MKTVKQVLDNKGPTTWHVLPDSFVYDALQLMADKEIGALLVLEGGRLVGVISERDYARKVILKGKSSLDTPVKEIMTRDAVCVRPEQTVEECMALVTEKRVRHLPVVMDDKVVGIISIGDLVKAVIDEKDFTIKQLESYIMGNR